MLYGALNDLHLYRGMMRGLDVLIDWLDGNDPAALDCGSHEIMGSKVFANVMEPTTRPLEGAHYETHRRYHDVQIDVRGREAFMVALGETTPVEPFNEADDFELVDAAAGIEGDLADGKFALFIAGEPHMPTLQYGDDGAQPIKKICFKILADEFWDE
ncbi:YhcH/YjgK/YiaL family protein [Collinsella tanakaei]|uniref:YhcH/YjgK/YiaL family protein n=1 Tax=Collinsella tanakaei TaxID=626935 RepID=UPI0025A46BFB|nr:YhcH/YjgK/YiaL family protein [Collinsella tanakaei]MDM8245956.1 YhcH/YjgK/YiaL family protein [Collinsella tanakaei]